MKAALPLFMQHRDKNTKKRRGSGQSFWDDFFPAFWTKFPWRSARNEDPLDDPAELEALAREAEDEAEMEAKKKMVTETEQVSRSSNWREVDLTLRHTESYMVVQSPACSPRTGAESVEGCPQGNACSSGLGPTTSERLAIL